MTADMAVTQQTVLDIVIYEHIYIYIYIYIYIHMFVRTHTCKKYLRVSE